MGDDLQGLWTPRPPYFIFELQTRGLQGSKPPPRHHFTYTCERTSSNSSSLFISYDPVVKPSTGDSSLLHRLLPLSTSTCHLFFARPEKFTNHRRTAFLKALHRARNRMAFLYPRQGHSFSSIYEPSKSGWSYCMTKPYCKFVSLFAIHYTRVSDHLTDGPPLQESSSELSPSA